MVGTLTRIFMPSSTAAFGMPKDLPEPVGATTLTTGFSRTDLTMSSRYGLISIVSQNSIAIATEQKLTIKNSVLVKFLDLIFLGVLGDFHHKTVEMKN